MSLKSYSDQEIIQLLQHDDERIVWLIFNQYWESLFLLSFSIVKNKFDAEDIVQDTIIAIWNKRHQLTIEYSLKAYLFTSVRYASYKSWKTTLERKNTSLDGLEIMDHNCPVEGLLCTELTIAIKQVVNALPERCRQVYLLSREDQLSHKEIAKRMNISTKTVENQLTKALRKLRITLGRTRFQYLFFIL